MCYGWTPQQLPNVGFMSLIWLFTYCRLEYIKLGSQKDPTWSDFPQALTLTQGARRYVTLFESPFVDSGLSERENNALRASFLLGVPPPPPEVQPLEGLQGIDLPEANLTQWASYVQDVASGMQKPPHAATGCPSKDMAGILHKLENLTGIGFAASVTPLVTVVGAQRQHLRPLSVTEIRLYGFRHNLVMPQWHLQ